eukprot:s2060_g1.t1
MDDHLEEISEATEVPPTGLNIPSDCVVEFFQKKRKAPTKPADLLIPLTNLSEEHVDDAIRTERAGHGRTNRRVQPFLQKTARTGRPSRDLGARGVRPKELSPIEAAREAAAKKGVRRRDAGGAGRRNSIDQSESNLPRNRDVLVGWQDLLNEIASSSRRLRAARGGAQAENAAESRPRTEESRAGSPIAAVADENYDGLWLSYRISEETVPNATLLRMWNYAVDPRKDDGIQALERVPRLTVTKREVQPLPVVHDLVQWRQTNKRRRETRKAKKESERNPTLEEMLIAIFGAEVGDLELLKEIQLILTEDADEALKAFQELEPKIVGALRRGRRGGFDEGKASAKLALSIADLQARQDKNVVRCKTLRRGFEHSRAIRLLPSDRIKNEPIAEQHMKEVVKSFTSVVDNCDKAALRTMVLRESHWAGPGFYQELQIAVGTAGLLPGAPDHWAVPDFYRDRTGQCWTSTASPRSQWALPDFYREL